MTWGLTQGMLGRSRESLEPSLTALGPNTYLTQGDFLKMLGVAFAVHFIIFLIAGLIPTQKVLNIPVRALSFKLGDQDNVAALGSPAGVGMTMAPLPVAAPVMTANVREEIARIAPVAVPVPAPVVKAKPVAMPTPKPVAAPKHIAAATPIAPVPAAHTEEPAIAPNPQQYVREVGQPAAQAAAAMAPAAAPAAPAGYGVNEGAPGGSGTESTRTESSSEIIRERYTQQISNWVGRHWFYPPEAAGHHARAIVRIRIDMGGTIRYYAIEESSHVQVLDAAAIDMVRRANPVPAVPADYPSGSLDFLVPITF